jgi:hypothetical protein
LPLHYHIEFGYYLLLVRKLVCVCVCVCVCVFSLLVIYLS